MPTLPLPTELAPLTDLVFALDLAAIPMPQPGRFRLMATAHKSRDPEPLLAVLAAHFAPAVVAASTNPKTHTSRFDLDLSRLSA